MHVIEVDIVLVTVNPVWQCLGLEKVRVVHRDTGRCRLLLDCEGRLCAEWIDVALWPLQMLEEPPQMTAPTASQSLSPTARHAHASASTLPKCLTNSNRSG